MNDYSKQKCDQLRIPSLTISALKGGSGKTLLTLGLARAWQRRGKKLVSFKKGPDYIDAKWLSRASGTPCYNLDPYLMPRPVIETSFAFRAQGSDFAVIEGNRGLYDGVDIDGAFSTAELAKWLNTPVILVIDCTKMTRTAAALVLGCKELDREVRIAGVVLNRIGGQRHESVLRKSIEKYTGIPVMGALPRMKKDPLPMRHLGVTPCEEHPDVDRALDELADWVAMHVDIDGLEVMAKELAPSACVQCTSAKKLPRTKRARIGVIKDSAFQFYYPENLEALEKAGAEIVFFSALSDHHIPAIDGLYIGGGFPETHAAQLAANTSLKTELRDAVESGLPVYAECGGLMYLGGNIIWKKESFQMTGILGWDFILEHRPVGHGYSIIKTEKDTPFFAPDTTLKGHEFHYSRPIQVGGQDPGELCCTVVRGHGFDGNREGLVYKNVFGTYTHIHALTLPKWADGIVTAAEKYRERQTL